ncbi:hypothetical protein VHP8226_03527 [Vibrio hippocampi]|uniref:Uncharacterized protein n=1 Tax=Vibrio hippocampi TaxID=654686 RepID=A0ABM8ZML8_9VIBR|nr:hypothetical protein VHP8226_03527 [Vibrio hippocampi]
MVAQAILSVVTPVIANVYVVNERMEYGRSVWR